MEIKQRIKNSIRQKCGDCGCKHFNVFFYEDGSLDYIECAECYTNIDWEV